MFLRHLSRFSLTLFYVPPNFVSLCGALIADTSPLKKIEESSLIFSLVSEVPRGVFRRFFGESACRKHLRTVSYPFPTVRFQFPVLIIHILCASGAAAKVKAKPAPQIIQTQTLIAPHKAGLPTATFCQLSHRFHLVNSSIFVTPTLLVYCPPFSQAVAILMLLLPNDWVEGSQCSPPVSNDDAAQSALRICWCVYWRICCTREVHSCKM